MEDVGEKANNTKQKQTGLIVKPLNHTKIPV